MNNFCQNNEINYSALVEKIKEKNKEIALPYIESLETTLHYMNISSMMLNNVYKEYTDKLSSIPMTQIEIIDNSKDVLSHFDDDIPEPIKIDITDKINKRLSKPLSSYNYRRTAQVTEEMINYNIEICGLPIDGAVFLEKTLLEFFHYSRISIDILYQIIGACLFPVNIIEDLEQTIITSVLNQLGNNSSLQNVRAVTTKIYKNEELTYMRHFDNVVKHKKTIQSLIKIPVFSVGSSTFEISSFVAEKVSKTSRRDSHNNRHDATDALNKVTAIQNSVYTHVQELFDVLVEAMK